MKTFKPNTTMNIPIELLERVADFLEENKSEFKSRNALIEKSLTCYMDYRERLKMSEAN